MVKDFLAMANAGGGFIIVGVDDKITELGAKFSGVSEENLASWETTRVSEYVNSLCSPPINIELYKFTSIKWRKPFVALEIPGHGKTPHFCIRDSNDSAGNAVLRRGAVYYRTKDKSSKEICDPADWDELLNRCVIDRKEELTLIFEQVLRSVSPSSPLPAGTPVDAVLELDWFAKRAKPHCNLPVGLKLVFWEVLVSPLHKKYTSDVRVILEALDESMVDHRGWPYIFCFQNSRCDYRTTDSSIYAVETEPFGSRWRFDYWEFEYTKELFYSRSLTDESSVAKHATFDPAIQVALIADAISSVGRLFLGLGHDRSENLQFAIRYSPARDIRTGSIADYARSSRVSEPFHDDVLTAVQNLQLLSMLNEPAQRASAVVATLLQKLKYPGDINANHLQKQAEEYLSKSFEIPRHMRILPRS